MDFVYCRGRYVYVFYDVHEQVMKYFKAKNRELKTAMNRRSGYSCTYCGCKNRTGGNVSLFFFPKDPTRSKAWIKICQREDLLKYSPEHIAKNYKICEEHFEKKYIMSGKIRRRLTDNAVPRHGSEDTTVQNVPPPEIATSALANILDTPGSTSEGLPATRIPQQNSPPKLSIRINILRKRKADFAVSRSTQTSAFLSSDTPRKRKLQNKVNALQKCKRRLLAKTLIPNEPQCSKMDFFRICHKFLNPTFSKIVKAQVELEDRELHGKRYSMEYKQFAFTLYSLSPRAYSYMSKIIHLPTRRSLEMMSSKLLLKPGLEK